MNHQTHHIFNGQEAALAYALTAERIFGNDLEFLNRNKAVIPILVNHLFQSLEISIKYAGIESGLFTENEARTRAMRSGHGIKELAALAVEKLGGNPFGPIKMAMTHFNAIQNSGEIISLMIAGSEFKTQGNAMHPVTLDMGKLQMETLQQSMISPHGLHL